MFEKSSETTVNKFLTNPQMVGFGVGSVDWGIDWLPQDPKFKFGWFGFALGEKSCQKTNIISAELL